MSLTDSSNLSATYVSHIETREFNKLKEEMTEAFLGISFDGTSRLGEAVNLTGRTCTGDFELSNRLLRFVTVLKHMNAPEFATIITRILCTELSIDPANLVCMSRDSVSVNGATCTRLQNGAFPYAENQMCISHTLNNVGEKLQFEQLQEFFTPWLELVGGRNPHRGAQSLWKAAVFPQTVPGYSHTRWHASAEIQFVLSNNFDKLQPFVRKLDELNYGDATRKKLGSILNSPDKAAQLALELAAMNDLERIVRTTYELEGDRLELLLVYDRVEGLRSFGRSIAAGAAGTLPNMDAVLRSKVNIQAGLIIEKVSTCI